MKIIGQEEKSEILEKAKGWCREQFSVAHKKNTLKLVDLEEFNINPFIWHYLAYFLEGNDKPESLAKVLIYPRILGTSVTTSFGTLFQGFITQVFKGSFGSTTPGIDLEFIDKIDGRKKYCQIKAGPNIVNYDDVTTVKNHFKDAINRAKINRLEVHYGDYLFCLLYGEPGEENTFIKAIAKDYPVIMGQEFWHRFTGDSEFYEDLAKSIGEVAKEFNMKRIVNKVIKELAVKIKEKYGE